MELGALEACCGPGDVASKEVWRCAAGVLPLFASRALELRRHVVGEEMRRYGGMETGCKRADVVT